MRAARVVRPRARRPEGPVCWAGTSGEVSVTQRRVLQPHLCKVAERSATIGGHRAVSGGLQDAGLRLVAQLQSGIPGSDEP